VVTPEDEAEERDIIMSLDSYVIIEYIKSSVDIILNLKFEEIEKRLMDKNGSVLDHALSEKARQEPVASDSQRSIQGEGPPKIYEELIQSLEADVRKHIRVRIPLSSLP